jgi:hypothetical protein
MFQPRKGDGIGSEQRLQFSSGDRQTDTVVKNVPEPLPAFALDLHHERRHGSKQESLIEIVSYLRFSLLVLVLVRTKWLQLFPHIFDGLWSKCRAGQESTPCFSLEMGALRACGRVEDLDRAGRQPSATCKSFHSRPFKCEGSDDRERRLSKESVHLRFNWLLEMPRRRQHTVAGAGNCRDLRRSKMSLGDSFQLRRRLLVCPLVGRPARTPDRFQSTR